MSNIDHQSPENIQARKDQEDPIIMYLIIRKFLNMSIGKTAAQCAHASQMLQLQFNEIYNNLSKETEDLLEEPNWAQQYPQYFIFSEWLKTSFRKVVLQADEKEWNKLKSEISEGERIIVIDAGLTELSPNTETVMGLYPMRKSQAPKVIKRLQTLK